MCTLYSQYHLTRSDTPEDRIRYAQDYLDFLRHFYAMVDAMDALNIVDADELRQDYADQVESGLATVRTILTEDVVNPSEAASKAKNDLIWQCHRLMQESRYADRDAIALAEKMEDSAR